MPLPVLIVPELVKALSTMNAVPCCKFTVPALPNVAGAPDGVVVMFCPSRVSVPSTLVRPASALVPGPPASNVPARISPEFALMS